MKIIVGIILFSIVFTLEGKDDISFRYGVLGRLQAQNKQVIELQDSSKIQTNDEIRINVGYEKDTYLYVIYQASQGGEYILFYPEESNAVAKMVDLPDTLYKTVLHWTPFSDPTGFETFYFINSSFALEDLSNLFRRYNKVNEKGKKKLAKKIKNELDNLDPESKQELASIGGRLDKPVVGGVAFRGDDGDGLKDMSLTHSCTGNLGIAYKKFILNHQ